MVTSLFLLARNARGGRFFFFVRFVCFWRAELEGRRSFHRLTAERSKNAKIKKMADAKNCSMS